MARKKLTRSERSERIIRRWPELDVRRLKTREEKWNPERVRELKIRKQQRRTFDPEKARELERAIASLGRVHSALQIAEYTWMRGPRKGQKYYVLIAGERRVRAVKRLLRKVPLKQIPVLIYVDPTPLQVRMLQALENTHDRPPTIEEGEHLGESFREVRKVAPGFPREQFAALMGRSAEQVRAGELFLRAPAFVQDLAWQQELSYSAAVEISKLSSDLSAEEVEEFARYLMLTKPRTDEVRRRVLEARKHRRVAQERGRFGALTLEAETAWDGPTAEENHRIWTRSVASRKILEGMKAFAEYWGLIQQIRLSGEAMPWSDRVLADSMIRVVSLMEAELPNLGAELNRREYERAERVLAAMGEGARRLVGEVEGRLADVIELHPADQEESLFGEEAVAVD